MNDFEFETEVEVEDQDTNREGKVTIKWGVEFELRKWGIKSTIPFVKVQEVTTYLTKVDMCESEEHDEDEKPFTFKLEDVSVESDWDEDKILCPQTLVISEGKFVLVF
jgi:hypothetical protein